MRFRSLWLACLSLLLVVSCGIGNGALLQRSDGAIAEAQPGELPEITTDAQGQIRVTPLPVAPELQNPWSSELEAGFWQRANAAIQFYADRDYGNTHQENEKRSYPFAMFDFLAGNRDRAIAFLQSEDQQASDHAHTEGIDYYFSFTLKGQIRKYFFFGRWLAADYRRRMFAGAQRWTEADPGDRPHPLYGNGDGSGEDWSIRRRGRWVDPRNTDNLRAMREVAVYLMAEETGNESVRQRYQQHLQRYVHALYHIGMGEWDSENYHGHTFAAYLNLYDFAQDAEVKRLAKAALDWFSAAAAVKYRAGGWGGPTKRDAGNANVALGSGAARLFWHYFDDTPLENPEPERDAIHVITSAYRPPQAVVNLAHRQFDRPVELLSTKPAYENWLPGRDELPSYWETTFFGQTYQMGSIASAFADGDVGAFKLMANNAQRGVDYFVANTGGDWVQPGKRRGDQIGQYRNLLIWLRPVSDDPFFFQMPKTAEVEWQNGIQFVKLEQTWLALHPIHLGNWESVNIPNERAAAHYQQEQTLRSPMQGADYAGFALEVGEAPSSSYEAFKQQVLQRSWLDLAAIAQGTVELHSRTGTTLRLTHNSDNELPHLVRNGRPYRWIDHLDLYRPTEGTAPISLGWKQGTLRVEAGGEVFVQMVE